MQLEIG